MMHLPSLWVLLAFSFASALLLEGLAVLTFNRYANAASLPPISFFKGLLQGPAVLSPLRKVLPSSPARTRVITLQAVSAASALIFASLLFLSLMLT